MFLHFRAFDSETVFGSQVTMPGKRAGPLITMIISSLAKMLIQATEHLSLPSADRSQQSASLATRLTGNMAPINPVEILRQ